MAKVADIHALRQQTGAGIMDCKQVLEESGGNLGEAVALLRKRGQKISTDRADRLTHEGVLVSRRASSFRRVFLLGLSCETDFVARSERFISLANRIADVCENLGSSSVEEILSQSVEGLSVKEHLDALISQVGEKVRLSHYAYVEGGYVVSYVHAGGKLGVLVSLNEGDAKVREEVGRNIAMQIAAMNPVSVRAEDISKEVLEREREIGREIARKEGKGEAILERIAEGYVKKFMKTHTLLSQSYVKDSSLNVEQYIKKADSSILVEGFRRLSLG